MSHPQQPASSQPEHEHDMPPAPVRRLRYTPTAMVPVAIAAICALPVAVALGLWGLLLVIPFGIVVIVLRRAGLDIAEHEVHVRGALSSVAISRSQLAGFRVDGNHVHLVRTDGSAVRVPTVRPRDLPMLRRSLFPGDAHSH